MAQGKPRFRTVENDLEAARIERAVLVAAAQAGALPVSPWLRFATVAGWWLDRFEAKVVAGERRERTAEAHRYHLDKHLLPTLGRHLVRTITVEDVAELLTGLRATGRSEKTTSGALATLRSVVRFAIRNGWAVDDPISKLEADERPRPTRRRQRVLGRDEIQALLAASLPRYRPLIATALVTGMRISELLGLTWDDVDLPRGVVHVRAQLSRSHRDVPARRVPPKTPSSVVTSPWSPSSSTSSSNSAAGRRSQRAKTGCLPLATARHSGTATPSVVRSTEQPPSPAWTVAIGHGCDSTIYATPSPAT